MQKEYGLPRRFAPRNDRAWWCGARRAAGCGERIERCRWQKKRDERVAAVKILSGRRKAAPKFWAPQQDHPALRVHNKGRRTNGASGTPPPTGALIDGAEDAILGDYLQPVYRINAAVPCKKRGNAVRYMYWKIPYF